MTDERNDEERENEADAGLIGGGGPAATIDDGDDEAVDQHGENLRDADRGDR